MIRERYRQWYLALAKLPTWGEEIDRQVHSYIKGVENIILANANWRYVGRIPSSDLLFKASTA